MTENEKLAIRANYCIINHTLRFKRNGKKVPRMALGFVNVYGKAVRARDIVAVLLEGRADRRATESFEMARAVPDMLLSRKDAHILGISIYRTGSACLAGHHSWRYVSNGGCVACCGLLLP